MSKQPGSRIDHTPATYFLNERIRSEPASQYFIYQENTMNTQFTSQPKPALVNVVAWITLASGIVNLFWGIGASAAVFASTWGIGIICVPITILPTVLGIFEIIYAAKLMSDPPQPLQPSTNLAILEIVCVIVGNLFAVVVGILALVFYNDLTVKDYFARLNGTRALESAVEPSSTLPEATMSDPQTSPSEEEPPQS